MIKHLGESLTPFETDGFSRSPEMPLDGEKVTVVCEAEDLTPKLQLIVDGQEEILSGTRIDSRRFSFDLGSFTQGQAVRYRFCAPGEETSWFSFDVLTSIAFTQPTALLRDGDVIRACFGDGLTMSFSGGVTLDITLERGTPQGIPCGPVTIPLPEGFSCEVGSAEKIWELKRFSQILCEGAGVMFFCRADGSVAKVQTRVKMPCGHVMGTGERFDAVDRKHHATNGRVVEKFTHQGNQSYLPMPFFFTEQGYGWYRDSDIPAEMTFEDEMIMTQETLGEKLTKDILFFGSPKQVLAAFLERTGKPALPPEWAFGIWMSANGWSNDAEVNAQLAALKQYDYPASVMVLEAWSDERTFYRWNDDGSWEDPEKTVAAIRAAGLHLVLWQIPVVKYEWSGEPGAFLTADTREAIEKGYVVKSASGSPYRITRNWFHYSMLPDFTNPAAVEWWFGKRKHLLKMGVEGFKTDGGEFLFEKAARLYDGTTGLTAHNLYPGQYIGAYQKFFQESGVNGVTFSRAGYVGAQTQPIHWAGDQMSEWSELQSQLRAGISAGLSGVLFWSFDIGGFAGELPSTELYLRATAMGCFSPVMQWHAEPRSGQFFGTYDRDYNNDRSPWNLAKKLGDSRIVEVACGYAHLRERLRPYLWEEAQYCVQAMRPMMAHLCLDFPQDEQAWKVEDEYMLGRRYLVAPIIEEGAQDRLVYMPRGVWRHFFTGDKYEGGWVRISCPLDQIPVFERVTEG